MYLPGSRCPLITGYFCVNNELLYDIVASHFELPGFPGKLKVWVFHRGESRATFFCTLSTHLLNPRMKRTRGSRDFRNLQGRGASETFDGSGRRSSDSKAPSITGEETFTSYPVDQEGKEPQIISSGKEKEECEQKELNTAPLPGKPSSPKSKVTIPDRGPKSIDSSP